MTSKKFCFIGHVDSGKSTCAGHLYALCGGLTDHEINKLKADSEKNKYQLWSRVFDIWEEEREKGKTHEFSILKLKYRDNDYELIDTPGHKTYIRSLIEGLAYFDTNEVNGCLMISMAKGEFEAGWIKGQTKEDIILARSLGMQSLIILFNKMDTIGWDKELYNEVLNKIKPFIESCKFRNVFYIPISGYEGVGLIDKNNLPQWYDGECFIDTLDKIQLNQIVVEEIKEETWNTILCDVKVLWVPHIITIGFQCIMHFDGREYDVSVEKIKKNKFLKEKMEDEFVLKSKQTIVKNKTTRKFLLRYNDNTIGFGRINKVKIS